MIYVVGHGLHHDLGQVDYPELAVRGDQRRRRRQQDLHPLKGKIAIVTVLILLSSNDGQPKA